ncbi:putative glycosyltransferases [Flavobacterium noncentrifugens]|uniref:Putative glycosyltransferase n=1 Tax=Flavobacterium noncentrifugens TaxID=1128970 RepID=A0A1G8V6X6_9FLAO|nr:glycosyltransferase family 2 protein [Flavobacterium noncentrifugens]GEP50369.1 putative glycosyltransferases [Flavobacterium noncentrifugens]SDJ61842.1 putative glycosyltransferase [Flavobacterium noncentrifugens]
MKLSVVSTLYRSKPFLDTFLQEILLAITTLEISDFELIFVNDGSPDDSLSHLIAKKKEIPQIKIVDFSRNFGHHYAIQAGLQQVTGERIFLIDNDLEVHPNVLLEFYRIMDEKPELDVVYGFQEQRKGGFIENFSGKIFWKVINYISEVKIPANILTERLMTRNYVESLLTLKDANLFLGGMLHWVGFNQQGVAVKKGLRQGQSTYSLKMRMQLMVQAVTSFSGKPLEFLFYFGLLVSMFSFLFVIYLVLIKIIYNNEVQLGWTSIIAINVMILGIVSTFLGLIGIYIFKIFKQVQGRPNYIIKKIL